MAQNGRHCTRCTQSTVGDYNVGFLTNLYNNTLKHNHFSVKAACYKMVLTGRFNQGSLESIQAF